MGGYPFTMNCYSYFVSVMDVVGWMIIFVHAFEILFFSFREVHQGRQRINRKYTCTVVVLPHQVSHRIQKNMQTPCSRYDTGMQHKSSLVLRPNLRK